MTTEFMAEVLENVGKMNPLVHSITNYVTVNDCANIILAAGGSPIMADDIGEAAEITSICSALVINIGTLNERTIKSMLSAGKKANELGIPIVLDPVGAGASALRTDCTRQLMRELTFSVIRGNISEIKFIAGTDTSDISGTVKGVDAIEADAVTEGNLDEACVFAKRLSAKTGAVIVMTGAIDIIASTDRAMITRNGHPLMSKITGTGCMLSAVVGAYMGANRGKLFEGTVAAVAAMGLCGELAYAKMTENAGGTGSFRTFLIDFMSKMDYKLLKDGAKIESR